MRRARSSAPLRVLELGCAVGANVPLFLELGADYYAIEGSASAVDRLVARFPRLKSRVAHGDFTADFSFDGPFDMIVDRSALTHNTNEAIGRTLQRVREALRPGGWFIGIDWFSSRDTEKQYGTVAEDEWTYSGFSRGRFAGVGRVHFSDEGHLRSLFGGFELEVLDEKIVDHREPARGQFATWNIVARRP